MITACSTLRNSSSSSRYLIRIPRLAVIHASSAPGASAMILEKLLTVPNCRIDSEKISPTLPVAVSGSRPVIRGVVMTHSLLEIRIGTCQGFGPCLFFVSGFQQPRL